MLQEAWIEARATFSSLNKELPPAQPGPQTAFLAATADIVIYGGAAGSGKTFSLLLEAARHRTVRGFGAVIFRRTYPQIVQTGGMWDESMNLYPAIGGTPLLGRMSWRWPSGARVGFAHMNLESDKLNYQGAQITMIGWDQLEHFSESMFFYMLSRNRSTCGVKPYIRATCNPDADSWLATFLAWWIDQDTGYPIPERAGVVRWFLRIGERLVWADSAEDLASVHPGVEPKSVTFIPAKVTDNAILMAKDPSYMANLLALAPVDRGRLLEGNWKIKAAAGKVFNRAWFGVTMNVPETADEVRFWDFAATERSQGRADPDFTASVKMRHTGDRPPTGADGSATATVAASGTFYVVDCTADQVGPADADQLFISVCLSDALAAARAGRRYRVRWEQEPGSAGKKETWRLVQALVAAFAAHGLTCDAAGIPSQGDKLTRATSMASTAMVGGVVLLAASWNDGWLQHMHGQPDLAHDDIMDASTGAFNELAGTTKARAGTFGRRR